MIDRGTPTRDRPYGWYEKAVRHAIREVFDADGQKASALGLYDALCELASNEQSNTFTVSHDKIATFAGLTGKTSKRIMPTFEKMEIIHVRRNGSDGLQTSSTYTLLPCPSKFLPQGLKVPTQGQKPKSDVSHVLNKSSEESPEKYTEIKNAPFSVEKGSDSSFRRNWTKRYSESELEVIDLYNRTCGQLGWRRANAYSAPLKEFLCLYLSTEGEGWETMFRVTIDERNAGRREYCTPMGNKLIRILKVNYEG